MDESIGDWMIEWEYEQRILHRIACPEAGYPASEARFENPEEWEKFTGEKWEDILLSV